MTRETVRPSAPPILVRSAEALRTFQEARDEVNAQVDERSYLAPVIEPRRRIAFGG